MRTQAWSLAVGLLCLATAASAEVKSISVGASGVLWLSCTYRLEKAIQRLEGVDKVKILMEPVRAEVTPRAGAWVEADRLRAAVKNAGFKPGVVRYTVSGLLTEWKGQPALRLEGSDRVVVLQAPAGATDAYERARQAMAGTEGRKVEVEGQFVDRAIASDKGSPGALRIQRLEMGS